MMPGMKRYSTSLNAYFIEELESFYQTVNGEPLDLNVLQFLTSNFQVNAQGDLNREGFMQFYLEQTAGDATETWHDLEKLGFDSNLKVIDGRYNK